MEERKILDLSSDKEIQQIQIFKQQSPENVENWSDLPPEILLKIFEKLQSPEIFKISEVCKYWFNVAQHPAIVKKTIVTLKDLSKSTDYFLNCNRKFYFKLILGLKHPIFDLPEKYFQFKEKREQNITEIILIDLNISNVEMFCQLLKDLKNLRKLKFVDCRFQDPKVYPSTPAISLNITSLEIKQSFRKDFVTYILSLAPNLRSLYINSFYYTQDYTSGNKEMDLKNYKIFWKLKLLNLTHANGALFESLTQPSSMESLTLEAFEYEPMMISNKFQYLKNLKVLKISTRCVRPYVIEEFKLFYITNDFIQAIFKHLYNLQELYLQDTPKKYEEPHITDFGITGFPEGYPMSRLDKLEIFELLTDTDGITDTSVRHIEGMKSLKQVKIGQLFSKSYFQ